MCSILSGFYQRKLHRTISTAHNLTSIFQDDALINLSAMLDFVIRLFAYVIILAATLALVLYLIMKFLRLFEGENENMDLGPTETNPIFSPAKTVPETCYGTCGEDIEKGNCSYSSSSSNSSEDLYDGKVCVICYDEQRDCFLVPCGHCVTCYVCAQRIFYGEKKTCPVCRRVIGKVRKL